MSDLYSVRCQNCGNLRPDDLSKVCDNCTSRQTRLLGYIYGHEHRAFLMMVFFLIGIMALLFLSGAAYLYYILVVLGI